MTTVTVYLKCGRPAGFEAKGHTGYAGSGEDIVCAAVSALTQTAYLGLAEYVGSGVSAAQSDGALRVKLPKGLSEEQLERAELILGTMLLGLGDTAERPSAHRRSTSE